MRILAVGGGSGGHVTPVEAVLREVRTTLPTAEIRFWCDGKFIKQARQIIGNFDNNISVQTIIAGKLRRYHHLSIMGHLMWPSLVLRNTIDVFRVFFGFIQSITKLIIWRPDVVFTKGGYVCLPVGIAARLLRIPLVIHDSDAHPGLTNRILSRWATMIATGAPLEYYQYQSEKSRYVGIPISPEFHEFTDKERTNAKRQWGIDESRPLLVVTGGGLGASRINNAVVMVINDLQKLASVILVSGSGQFDELRSITPQNDQNFQLHPFISKDMALLLGAADVVIARAGATTILELASLARPTILVPNGKLTGGHQLKNAAVYMKKDAVVVVDENKIIDDPHILVRAVKELLSNPKQTNSMVKSFSSFVMPNAARDVADMIISCVK